MSGYDTNDTVADPLGLVETRPVTVGERKSSEFRTRAISAAVLATVVVLLAVIGGWPFRILAVVTGIVVLQEWSGMTGCLRPFGLAQRFTVLAMFAVAMLVLFAQYGLAIIATLVCFLIAYSISFVKLRQKPREPDARHWSWLSLGFLYSASFMVAFAVLRGDTAFGLAACAFLLAVVWATDTFAYFVGKTFGGPKLAPRVSPNKTWSGFLGGITFAVIAGLGVAYVYALKGLLPAVSLWLIPIAIILSVTSQMGDLFESWVKRRSGAKDSGRIIPGHGGMMDRIDGLGAAAVGALVMIVIFSRGTDMSDTLFLMLQ